MCVLAAATGEARAAAFGFGSPQEQRGLCNSCGCSAGDPIAAKACSAFFPRRTVRVAIVFFFFSVTCGTVGLARWSFAPRAYYCAADVRGVIPPRSSLNPATYAPVYVFV